jgi:hypothetical protein
MAGEHIYNLAAAFVDFNMNLLNKYDFFEYQILFYVYWTQQLTVYTCCVNIITLVGRSTK